MPTSGPQIPFGAVYFRKSNPPREDWERDYAVAAEDGLNIFRHWFMWSAIERRPGEYDFGEYDRQLDLAAENGIKTIIAELSHTTPEWAIRKYEHARVITSEGRPLPLVMGPSSATGGFAGGSGGLTLNSVDVREIAGAFLTALASRYKGHPGLWGYDVWNEVNYGSNIDYSSHTQAEFRKWLRSKYGDLETLSRAWYRYSHAEWDDIMAPVQTAPYPECLDWLQFKRENFYGHMQWKIDTIRAIDPDCLIAAHGVAGAITEMAARGADDWLAASKVEVYGLTWVPGRRGFKPWQNFFGPDLTRSAARGKPFWHAERPGGPLWMQPQVVGRDREDGRVMEPEDIRLLTLTSFSAGARGVLNLRYRPLLDGPLFGAFGSYGMDGSRTPRSNMASDLAKWANAPEQKAVFEASPVRGDIGILVVPETQQWAYLLNYEGKYDTYVASMWGAYRGFFDNGLQADWVHIDDIDNYDALYFPYPIMLTSGQAKSIADWVGAGGALIAEACPGYFGDRGKVGTVQPNNGLDKLFGVREEEVEFMPDIGDRIRFDLDGLTLQGGGYLQSYALEGATGRGKFEDGRLAIAEHSFGKGRTLLVGTHPSVAYYRTQGEKERDYFAKCFAFTGRTQHAKSGNTAVQIRVQRNGEQTFVWVLNPTREVQQGQIRFGGRVGGTARPIHWAGKGASFEGVTFSVPPRDAIVAQIKRGEPL